MSAPLVDDVIADFPSDNPAIDLGVRFTDDDDLIGIEAWDHEPDDEDPDYGGRIELNLNRDEVTQLRDALTAWLNSPSTPER